jgi:hypothetical protein
MTSREGKIAFRRISDAALARADLIVRRWLPDGRREGAEWCAINPTRNDHRKGSFKVNLRTGRWSDFATGQRGVISSALRRRFTGCPRRTPRFGSLRWLGLTLMSADPFAPLGGGLAASGAVKRSWTTVLPVPADAPKPPASHHRLGKPVATWCYRSAKGEILGFVSRFETPDGKVFRPLTYARPVDGGKAQWRWESWAPPRPLYALGALAERADALVVVTEGEKAADALGALVPAMVTVTSPNGSKSAGKADWSSLRGRRIVIWPDADSAGLAYANEVSRRASAAGALSVAIVSPPAGVKVGWDAADAKAEGWTEARREN